MSVRSATPRILAAMDALEQAVIRQLVQTSVKESYAAGSASALDSDTLESAQALFKIAVNKLAHGTTRDELPLF